jgi:tetratricopeptide (TPR) repeat protein
VELRNRFSQFGLATWYRRMNRPDESIRRLERAVLYCRDAAEEHALSMHAANALKREGRWRDAVDIWAERVKLLSDPAMRAEPCVELAKYYEHQVKDFGKALEWVRVALEPWRESRDLGRLLDAARQTDLLADMTDQDPGPAEGALAALVHRFKRLERRLEK